jgi:predicted MFS family arabinose efflux permease
MPDVARRARIIVAVGASIVVVMGAVGTAAPAERRSFRVRVDHVMTVLLLTPLTAATAIMFGAVMGLVWWSTVPLTKSLVATLFGPRDLSSPFGIVFLSQRFGALLGGWLGGRVFDSTGDDGPVSKVPIVLGLAADVHLPIAVRSDRSTVLPAKS